MSTARIDSNIRLSGFNASGLRRFAVRMLNSNWSQLNTNEIPLLLNALKHSRYPDVDLLYSLDFKEEETWYDPDDFKGTLTLVCKYGVDDITSHLVDSNIVWSRYSLDSEGNERTMSDKVWNLNHGVTTWPTGRTQLMMGPNDINAESDRPSYVRFDVIVVIDDGRGDCNIYTTDYEIN